MYQRSHEAKPTPLLVCSQKSASSSAVAHVAQLPVSCTAFGLAHAHSNCLHVPAIGAVGMRPVLSGDVAVKCISTVLEAIKGHSTGQLSAAVTPAALLPC
jgi:hypothetical protein